MDYTKPSLTFNQQADLLISRGLICNRDELVEKLMDVNYYRLSGYWNPFLRHDGSFKNGTEFSTIWTTYVFDRRFRLIVFDAIERVEVYVRTQLAYELSHEQDPFGYELRKNLPDIDNKEYKLFIDKALYSYQGSREEYINYFKGKYGDRHRLPPYWILVEILDFGQMYRLYQGAPKNVKSALSEKLGITPHVLGSWLKTLNIIRNIAAHHARLWNRVLGIKPVIPKKDTRWFKPVPVQNDRMFAVLTILTYLLDIIAPNSAWMSRLLCLFAEYPTVPKSHIGFLPGWENVPFWEFAQGT